MEFASKYARIRRPRWKLGVGLLVTGALAAGAVTAYAAVPRRASLKSADATGTASADASTTAVLESHRLVDPDYNPHRKMPSISFLTVDDPKDLTFNQLLGINDHGRIVGYFGSGADAKHPNKGYQVLPDYDGDNFTDENFPGSAQTQVVGVNNDGTTVGFYVDANGANIGFVRWHNTFLAVANPATTAKPAFNQLLGVNNKDIAAGFYNDAAGAAHGYLYSIAKRTFTPVRLPVKVDSLVATGVNDKGDVSGFYTIGKKTSGFVLRGRNLISINLGANTNTQALGLDNAGQVVGSFVDAAGKMHGFVWQNRKVRQIDDPNGKAGTLVNGIDNRNQIVGFFVDAKGNTNGFLARLR